MTQMTNDEIVAAFDVLNNDPERRALNERLKQIPKRTLTPKEYKEQAISLCLGGLSQASTTTREDLVRLWESKYGKLEE